MATWQDIPALGNKISNDIPALKILMVALSRWTDKDWAADKTETATGANPEVITNPPKDAKRLATVSGGVRFEKYDGSAWGSVGKLKHDAESVDGFDASQSASANSVAVRNSDGALPGDILGNANTATTAYGLDDSYTVPIALGGTGSGYTTANNTDAKIAKQARINLGANNATNIDAGVLDTEFGGTGRTDGRVTDVYLTDYSVGALSVGQIGKAAGKSAVDCDSLTTPGRYACSNCTVARHYPVAMNTMVEVQRSPAGWIIQTAWTSDNYRVFRRMSTDSGSTWTGWLSEDYNGANAAYVYVAKSGNDAYNGLTADAPVLTIDRAIRIAKGLKVHNTIVFCFGPGEWGALSIYGSAIPCNIIKITNFANSNKSTIADYETLTGTGNTGNEPPHFTELNLYSGWFQIGNVNADKVYIRKGWSSGNNCFKFGALWLYESYLSIGAFLVNKVTDLTSNVFWLEHSFLYVSNAGAKFLNSPTNAAFINATGACEVAVHASFAITGTFAGKKFTFNSPPQVRAGLAPTSWPGSAAGTGPYFYASLPHMEGGGPNIFMHHSGVTKGTNPTDATKYWTIPFLQKGTSNTGTNQRLGMVETSLATNGTVRTYLAAYKNEASATTNYQVGIEVLADGTAYGTAPTPADAADNSTKIATTAWCRKATGNFALNAAACRGNAANVTGTVAIAHGGTGATDRLTALKNLTNQSVGTPTHFLCITSSWATGGYCTVAQAKSVLGINGLLPTSGGTITGTLVLSRTTDLDIAKDNAPALIIGGTRAQAHIEIDNNEICAKANGTSGAVLYLLGTSTCAVTPANGDSSTKIATTAWCNATANSGVPAYSARAGISNGSTYTTPNKGVLIAWKYTDWWSGHGTIKIGSYTYTLGVSGGDDYSYLTTPVKKGVKIIPSSLNGCHFITG